MQPLLTFSKCSFLNGKVLWDKITMPRTSLIAWETSFDSYEGVQAKIYILGKQDPIPVKESVTNIDMVMTCGLTQEEAATLETRDTIMRNQPQQRLLGG